jgi:hypothetical protein
MGHFHKLLCEEMIFPLPKGKNDGLRYEVIIFSRGFIRKSLYKIFEQINEKFCAGINGYFCIKKILHFNGNDISTAIGKSDDFVPKFIVFSLAQCK